MTQAIKPVNTEDGLGQAAGSKSSLSIAIALIGITAFVSLMISHYYLVNGDDLLEIWGDKASVLGTLLHTQRTFPLEIDPLLYHLLTFVEISLWGIETRFAPVTFPIRISAHAVVSVRVCSARCLKQDGTRCAFVSSSERNFHLYVVHPSIRILAGPFRPGIA